MSHQFILLIFSIFIGFTCYPAPKKSPLYDSWIRINVDKKDGSQIQLKTGTYNSIANFKISSWILSIQYDQAVIAQIPYTMIGDSILKIPFDTYKVVSVNDTNLVLLENDDGRPGNQVYRFTFIKEKYYPDYLFNKLPINYLNDSTVLLNKHFLHYYTGMWDYRIENVNKSGILDGSIEMEILLNSIGETVEVKITGLNDIPESVAQKAARVIKKTWSWDLLKINRKFYYKINIVTSFQVSPPGYIAYIKLF